MNFNIAENIPMFLESFDVIVPGYLGIFVVMGLLIGVITVLNKFTSK